MLVTFATFKEAQVTLSSLNGITQVRPALFQYKNAHILITGVGYCEAMVRLLSLPFRPQSILNLGIAGSLSKTFQLHQTVIVSSVQLYAPKASDEGADKIHMNAFPPIVLYPSKLKNWNLGSAKAPGFDLSKPSQYYNIGLVSKVESRELSLEPKSNASAHLGIHTENQTQLITTPMPIHGGHLYQRLQGSQTLVDMEGYGIAYVAKEWNIPCKIIKVVSDFSKHNATEQIDTHLHACSTKLFKLFIVEYT